MKKMQIHEQQLDSTNKGLLITTLLTRSLQSFGLEIPHITTDDGFCAGYFRVNRVQVRCVPKMINAFVYLSEKFMQRDKMLTRYRLYSGNIIFF